MSFARSDNEQLNHPKPEFEHYRKIVSGVYVDWTDSADIVSNITIAYRKHKTFRIAGQDYLCEADGTTFTLKGSAGGGLTVFTSAPFSGGETTYVLSGIGSKSLTGVAVFQGMRPLKRVAEATAPGSGEYRIITGTNTIGLGDAMEPTEILTVIS